MIKLNEAGKKVYINKDDLLHREDGPAIEFAFGGKEWYINGIRLTEEEFNNRNKGEMSVTEVEKPSWLSRLHKRLLRKLYKRMLRSLLKLGYTIIRVN